MILEITLIVLFINNSWWVFLLCSVQLWLCWGKR